jgi:2-methylcitrate dehydratase PrpD
MSKFSINHSAAVAYVDRAAGIAQYTDARAKAADILEFRAKVTVATVDGFRKDQAAATLVARDGTRHVSEIAHASGTTDNPMSDAALEAKFMANAEPVLGAARARRIVETVAGLDTLDDVRHLTGLCA